MGTLSEDEVQIVRHLIVQSLTHQQRHWVQAMPYARLFTPGTVVRSRTTRPAMARTYAYQHSVASGLLYAEGVACHHGFPNERTGWCVDPDTGIVVEATFVEPGTAYFGVVLRPEYMRRFYEASHDDDGNNTFRGVYNMWPPYPMPDPAVDIVHDLGRDIPASVRNWPLTADTGPDGPKEPPAWVLDELRSWDGGV